MEKTNQPNDIVLLFDSFSQGSSDLYESFKNAGYDIPAVCLSDDGFLPEGVVNVYEYFLGDFNSEKYKGSPLYFNQISIPDYWEIRGNNSTASVYDKSRERARIFFEKPSSKRLVKVVDWIDEAGRVRCSEHYNKYGAMYARTIFNKKSQKVNKSYFDAAGREVIVENFVTGDIILNRDEKVEFYSNKTEFVAAFMEKMGYANKRIFFNSLSIPFFVSNYLAPNKTKSDILFWQENTKDEIPGNMQMILDGRAGRCDRVIVQNKDSYEKLIALKANPNKLSQLGFIYSFTKENLNRPSALICTNTENVEKLAELVEAMPGVTFHVAAITEMSAKLMSHERYDNVRMYPNVKSNQLDRLFLNCDFYLDINHEGEIVSATRRAFLANMLILGFKETAHGKNFTNPKNLFKTENFGQIADKILTLLEDRKKLQKELISQQKYALSAKVSDYSL